LEHEFYEFPYIGNFIIPTDELHHFSEGRYTNNQILLNLGELYQGTLQVPEMVDVFGKDPHMG
jgi:hypothetical protein